MKTEKASRPEMLVFTKPSTAKFPDVPHSVGFFDKIKCVHIGMKGNAMQGLLQADQSELFPPAVCLDSDLSSVGGVWVESRFVQKFSTMFSTAVSMASFDIIT